MKSIIIDAGHGGRDSGAVWTHDGKRVREKDITLILAEKVRNFLSGAGYDVILTREDDRLIPLSSRPRVSQASAFVSIHVNSSVNAAACGFETWTRRSSSPGDRLAGKIQDHLITNLIYYHQRKRTKNYQVRDRGVKYKGFTVLCAALPSCLVECGFIRHRIEGALLLDDDYLWTIANAIQIGVRSFC